MISDNDLGRLLIALEHDRMDRDTDRLYQSACATYADRVTDDGLWARLQRAAVTCHHCHEEDR